MTENNLYEAARKLHEDRKRRQNETEELSMEYGFPFWLEEETDYIVQRLTTEGESQPRGDYRVIMMDGVTVWVECKAVGNKRWNYLDDFKIPMPRDFKTPSGWSDNDRFLFIIVNGETGQCRTIEVTEPWEYPLKKWRAKNKAAWGRECFTEDLSERPETIVPLSDEIKDNFESDSGIRIYGGY